MKPLKSISLEKGMAKAFAPTFFSGSVCRPKLLKYWANYANIDSKFRNWQSNFGCQLLSKNYAQWLMRWHVPQTNWFLDSNSQWPVTYEMNKLLSLLHWRCSRHFNGNSIPTAPPSHYQQQRQRRQQKKNAISWLNGLSGIMLQNGFRSALDNDKCIL